MAFEQVRTILKRLQRKEEVLSSILDRWDHLDDDPRWNRLGRMLAAERGAIGEALAAHEGNGKENGSADPILDTWIQNPPEIERMPTDPLPDDAAPDALVRRAVELDESSREACHSIVEGAQTPPRVREMFERLLSLYDAKDRKSAWNALQQEDV